MNTKPFLALWLVFFPLCFVFGQETLPRLKVSDNQRFLVTEEGNPFFWMADTAWELFHRCDREEAAHYLKKRAEQGFNVVQAVALAEIDGLNTPNPYGETPLVNNDPNQPNPAYFSHVDTILQMAAAQGIYVALLPTWGDKVFTHSWGKGPEVFTEENAMAFGYWIGNRYKDQSHIIWVIGGDRNPRAKSSDEAIWRALASGIGEGVGGHDKALMTFHPQPAGPGGSSNWFHDDDWLDFNMHQTGHCANQPTYKKISHDYALQPVKPTLDGEPLYEDHPNCFNARELGYSLPEDIRRIMYWNVFAGAFGQSYGCHDVWQMYTTEREGINGPLRPWKEALYLPMANQVKHLKNLMLSRPFLTRIPAQEMIIGTQEDNEHFVIATRDSEGSYAMIYFPTGKPLVVDSRSLTSKTLQITWYDPRTGNAIDAGFTSSAPDGEFTPPTRGKGNDWVLILDAV
ncbi:glycoside hydrolase family 140 protein [Cyclobacterium jeungdonense]|uniref:Glycoside hydrolase family 140 protein n=1 Tax=Cyclobacterium jeungdonense TaxID=708087 RepID=A0ABT8CA24_9BACT|nr:glycoside hydrolase family 140 protein [Cyclobacterium jeungdonense]MDN3689629.1 glycoside hydrolase family 140 protein [Cyclobacterium jeungdonense]